MTIARRLLIDESRSRCYHLVSRCVRRAFLCGEGHEHRRRWIEEMLRDYSSRFSIDVLGFAVMSNHLHVIARNRPEQAQKLSNEEVARRWAALFPLRDGSSWSEGRIANLARNQRRIGRLRRRLSSLSWFMKLIKERVSRRANREDGCKGAFWESRFRSTSLLDQGALLAAMVYVDLNPVRAGMAATPEESGYTSVRLRAACRQAVRAGGDCGDGGNGNMPDAESDLWLVPLSACTAGEALANRIITLEHYLDLVDATGRLVVAGKRGVIPAHLRPILERLDIEVDAWLATMRQGGRLLGTAIGSAWSRAREATRRSVKRIVDKAGIYRQTTVEADPSAAPF